MVEYFISAKSRYLQMVSLFLLTCVWFILFYCIIDLAKTSTNRQEKNGRSRHFSHSWSYVKCFLFFFFNFMIFSSGLSYEAWITLQYDLSAQCFQSFYHKDVINVTDCVFESWDNHMTFFFCSVGVIHSAYWFAYVQSSWHS